MKKTLLFSILAIIWCNSNAQTSFDDYYFRDISFDFGIYPSLTSSYTSPELFGQILSIKTSHYPTKHLGYRLGITKVNHLDGSSSLYSIPLYLSMRTRTRRSLMVSQSTDSFGDLLFQLFMSIFPRNVEYNMGINLGMVTPDSGQGYTLWDGQWFKYDFNVNHNFYATADAGFRLNYKIWRFGLVLSPTVSYLLTKNWEFMSELPNDVSNGYKPTWFLRGTIGLAFAF